MSKNSQKGISSSMLVSLSPFDFLSLSSMSLTKLIRNTSFSFDDNCSENQSRYAGVARPSFAIVTDPSNVSCLNSILTLEDGSFLDLQLQKTFWIFHMVQAQFGIVVPFHFHNDESTFLRHRGYDTFDRSSFNRIPCVRSQIRLSLKNLRKRGL